MGGVFLSSLPIDGPKTKLEVLFLPLYLSFFFSHGPPVTKLEALSSPFRVYLFLKFSLLGLPLHVHPFLRPIEDNQRHKKGRREKKKKKKKASLIRATTSHYVCFRATFSTLILVIMIAVHRVVHLSPSLLFLV